MSRLVSRLVGGLQTLEPCIGLKGNSPRNPLRGGAHEGGHPDQLWGWVSLSSDSRCHLPNYGNFGKLQIPFKPWFPCL